MKKQLLIIAYTTLVSISLNAQKMSLQRAEKFYKSNDLIRAEKEMLRAVQPPFSSVEEWSRILNYDFLIKADLYFTNESLTSNLHKLTSLVTTYSNCEKVDTIGLYLPKMKNRLISISQVLLDISESAYKKGKYTEYLTLMDYYMIFSEKLSDDTALNYAHIAQANDRANHKRRALFYWRKMIDADHNVQHGYNEMLSILHGMGEYDEVDELLNEVKEVFPGNFSFAKFEIMNLMAKDLTFSAKKLAEQTVKEDSDNIDVVFLLGMLNSKLKNHDEALDSFLDVAHADSAHFETHMELGKHFWITKYEDGNLVLAKHYLEKAEALNPDNAELLELLKNTYLELRDNDNFFRVNQKLASK